MTQSLACRRFSTALTFQLVAERLFGGTGMVLGLWQRTEQVRE